MRTSRFVATVAGWLMLAPSALAAQDMERAQSAAQDGGLTGLWVLANLSYAGMRAQGHPSVGWRFVSFVCGLPGTLLTTIFVREGEERAYGVDLPRSASPKDEPSELRFVRRQ